MTNQNIVGQTVESVFHIPIIELQLSHYAGEQISPDNVIIQLQDEEQTEITIIKTEWTVVNFGTRGTDNLPFTTRARVNGSTFVIQGGNTATDTINSVESFKVKSLTADGITYTNFIYR